MENYGLPRKSSNLYGGSMNPDGTIRPDSQLGRHIMAVADDAFKRGYNTAVNAESSVSFKKDVADSLYDKLIKYLDPLVRLCPDEMPSLDNLDNDIVRRLISCLQDYSRGLRGQINNTNKTNFREGTRAMLLRSERTMGEPYGMYINELLDKRFKKFCAPHPTPDGNEDKTVEDDEEEKPKKIKGSKEYTSDPTDILKNN